MASRVLVVLALVIGAVAVGGARGQPAVGAGLYAVRVDPRLCPSPLCGGYWVALVNRPQTRCHDGLVRARCYVARAVGADGRALEASIPDGALARGTLSSSTFDGIGTLGVLTVTTVFGPAGKGPEVGRYHRVTDLGIRCVRAPCFSMRAAMLNGTGRTTISGLVLTALGSRQELEQRSLAAVASKHGLLARGRIVRTAIEGRELHVTRVFLRSQG